MSIKQSLVIPCFNEEGNVDAFFEVAVKAMADYTADYELVFVNDGSRDATAARLNALHAAHPERHITVVHFSRNFGKEAAMYAGLAAAKGEYVTIIDADLQQRPEVAVLMARLLDTHPEYDAVAAYPARRAETGFMGWCKTSFYKVINKMAEVDLIEDASDFRTLRRPVVDALLSMTEYHRFSKGLFAFVGFNTYSMPYEVQQRNAGETKWSFGKLMKYALDGIMAYTDLPLKLPLYLGGGFCVLGVLGLLLCFVVNLITWYAVVFPWALASLLVLLCGILLVAIGVMGAYIGKIHAQVKNRPVYIVWETRSYEE